MATLLDLTEPLFQQICVLNRLARSRPAAAAVAATPAPTAPGDPAAAAPGTPGPDYDGLRGTLETLLDRVQQGAAAGDPILRQQAEKIRLPLIFFVDSMVAESGLPVAAQWHRQRLAYEQKELAGDEKFFDLLDETMAESGPPADERLVVFYTCLGLGFTGWYAGQPEYLRSKMLLIASRIGRYLPPTEPNVRLCPEAYDCVDPRNLITPRSRGLWTVTVIFLGALLTVLAVTFLLYRQTSAGLADSLSAIFAHDLTHR